MIRWGVNLGTFILLFVCMGLNFRPTLADALVTVLENHVDYEFGEQITFRAQLQSSIPIRLVEVLYRPRNAANTLAGEMTLDKDVVTYKLDLLLNPQFIQVFSIVEYWYRVTLQDGQVVKTDNFAFQYDDNRFTWQELKQPPFRVYWVDGDQDFGQSVLDAARNGIEQAQGLIDFPDPNKVDIFVYSKNADMQFASQLEGFDQVAGQAIPEYGVVLVSLPPGPAQLLEIRRTIPHELVHILLYEKFGERYKNIPKWLNEGLASLNEPFLNLENWEDLQGALENGSVFPMESLCSDFRREISFFNLSYAQSESFTRYLYVNYGSTKLEELLSQYADGVECTRAPGYVYGQSLAHLENRWLSERKGETPARDWFGPLLPWLVILAAVLFVPVILAFRPYNRPRSHQSTNHTLHGD